MADYPPCRDAQCGDVVIVRTSESPHTFPTVALEIRAVASTWTVRFNVVPDRDTYIINPGRLWFWTFVATADHVEVVTSVPGVSASLDHRTTVSHGLY